jgi:hypothetical protein
MAVLYQLSYVGVLRILPPPDRRRGLAQALRDAWASARSRHVSSTLMSQSARAVGSGAPSDRAAVLGSRRTHKTTGGGAGCLGRSPVR